MGFPREEHWNGFFPTQGSNLGLLRWPAGSLLLSHPGSLWDLLERHELPCPWGQCVLLDPEPQILLLAREWMCAAREEESSEWCQWGVSPEICRGQKEGGAVLYPVYRPNLLFPRKQSLFCPRAIWDTLCLCPWSARLWDFSRLRWWLREIDEWNVSVFHSPIELAIWLRCCARMVNILSKVLTWDIWIYETVRVIASVQIRE